MASFEIKQSKNNLKLNSISFLIHPRQKLHNKCMLTTILERVILLKSFLSFMNIALERLFVKYIIYVYIQSFLYILFLETIPTYITSARGLGG